MATIRCGTVHFRNIQAVIFDKDGTLADSHDFLWNLAQKRARLIDAQIPGVQEPLLMAFGLNEGQLNPAGLMAVGSRLENEIAAAAYVAETGRDWGESLAIVRSAFMEADSIFKRKADHTPLFEGVRDLLQNLTRAGVKIGILSADTTQNVRDFIEQYDLMGLVQAGRGTDMGPGKPDPVLFHQICAELGVEPQGAIAIGDSTTDMEMARAAGAAGCVGVTWGGIKPAALAGADVLVPHFSAIQVVHDQGVSDSGEVANSFA